jgi:hypothetical protein
MLLSIYRYAALLVLERDIKMSQYSNEPEQSAASSSGPGASTGGGAMGGTAAGSYGTGNLPPARPRGRRRRRAIIATLITLLLIILVLLFFFPRPTATVTLTPASKPLSNAFTIPIATNLLSSPQQGSQTGTPKVLTIPGTHATGILTFKNYTLHWLTIPAGTLVTDITGQQVVTDRDLLVPPDPPIVPGIASVSAHAEKVGQSGNIQAMSIAKPCCLAGIYVLNGSAFSGGVDDQKAPIVQQSDIDKVANILKTSLMQKALADIQSQLKPGEQLVNATPRCSPKVTSNPGVGASVPSFKVNVSLACSDAAYNSQIARPQAEDLLKQMVAQQFGPGFNLVGNIATTIESATPGKNGGVDVVVSASGTWKYQFTDAQKSDMAKHIARATIDNAKSWLLQQRGVVGASISVRGPIIDLSGGNVVPDDLRAITING